MITTALCGYLQTIGQKEVPAERAAIIYSLDPVYGAVFSNIVLGESFGLKSYVGSFLILTGIVISNFAQMPKSERNAGW